MVGAALGSSALRSGWLRELYLNLAYPEPAPAGTGSNEGEVLLTLRAAAETLLGTSAAERAVGMLQARARELPGHLEMQGRFAAWLDLAAREREAQSYRAASPDTRTELLTRCMRLRSNSDLRRAWYGVTSRDRVLWDRQILRPILDQYSRSDAWLEMGYDSFPGDPSGLDAYRERLQETPAGKRSEVRS